MPGIGFPEMVVILVLALIVLGPKRLPEAGRGIGRAMREFKDGVSGGGAREALDSGAEAPRE